VFNVADPSVVGGAILLVTLSVMGYDFDTVGRRRVGDDAERSDAEERRLVKADDDLAVADAPQDTETPDVPAEGAPGDEPQDGTVGSRADQR
jgi:signal peptidase II